MFFIRFFGGGALPNEAAGWGTSTAVRTGAEIPRKAGGGARAGRDAADEKKEQLFLLARKRGHPFH